MASKLTCLPPLGQSTVVARDKIVNFLVQLQVDLKDAGNEWNAEIWHDCNANRQWTSLPLKPIDSMKSILVLSKKGQSDSENNMTVKYFEGGTPIVDTSSEPVHFTARYRLSAGDWNWAKDEFSYADGELCCLNTDKLLQNLNHYVEDLSPDIEIAALLSDPSPAGSAAEIRTWSLLSNMEAAQTQSAFRTIRLGLPKAITRWFSLARISRAWLCPRQGRSTLALREDAILVSFLRNDGLHLVFLALSLHDVLSVFQSSEEGYILWQARNDGLSQAEIRVLASVATTFEAANAAVVGSARAIVEQLTGTSSSKDDHKFREPPSNAISQRYESWYDGFIYCTWNGLGQSLTEQKILYALETLKNHDVSISTLIIDDNWQSLDNHGDSHFGRRWMEFEANKEGFPNGLKHALGAIRGAHPYIKDVAVWHGIFGYWNATSPNGKIAEEYETRKVKKQDNDFLPGGHITVVDADDAHRMYDDFYKFLSDAGITTVKTDVQYLLDHLNDAEDRRQIIPTYQQAWSSAVMHHLNGKAISSMSQIPQNLFYTQLLKEYPQYVVRNSDDFFPDEPSAHSWHIFCNAHNSVLTQHLNVLPDWDMFQTNHGYSGLHAAARCLSGGPIYITDEPGLHDHDLINQMTARTPHRTVILRTKVSRSMQVYNAHGEPALCKLGTSVLISEYEIPILGVFNVSKEGPLSEFISLDTFPNLNLNETYIIRAHSTGYISEPVTLHPPLPRIFLDLPFWGWEVLSAFPLRTFPSPSPSPNNPTTELALLGLQHKITGAAAITNLTFTPLDDPPGIKIQVSLKALGVLGIYISDLPYRTLGESVLISGTTLPSSETKPERKNQVLELNLEAAWAKTHRSSSDWTGEVDVELEIL